jgi:hypothetical protein
MSSTFSPVTDGLLPEPPTYPCGIEIADKVSIHELDFRAANSVYESHHSYMPGNRVGWHYGVYLDDRIVGSITFDNWPASATIRGYESNQMREVARVCIANDTPNLASCAMSKAQDRFVEQADDDVEMLVTYVREDYDGSMFAALRGKGWEHDGDSTGGAPGNRESKAIHDWDKERWVCPL